MNLKKFNRNNKIVDEMELAMVQQFPKGECEINHQFTPGLYIREMRIKKGTALTSKIHRFEHPFILFKGIISVMLGDEIVTIQAPFRGITPAFSRRVGYAHTDCTWVTFHPTNKTTVEEVEAEIIVPHDNELLSDETKILHNLKQKEELCL